MGIVLQQLGDVVDLDCCLWPHAEGFAENSLGMRQERLQRQKTGMNAFQTSVAKRIVVTACRGMVVGGMVWS